MSDRAQHSEHSSRRNRADFVAADSPSEVEYFRISTGLKDIIGRDLITNDFVAVFELVKNAFDAFAKRVDVIFLPDGIILIDDGKGMSLDDITTKWLFVAYSAKRDGTEDSSRSTDYRSKLDGRHGYAGNKGIGRFSCDRLGEMLTLVSRSRKEASVQRLEVNWRDFETDGRQEFIKVPVNLVQQSSFSLASQAGTSLPSSIDSLLPKKNGTVLYVRNLRSAWDRNKLLDLHTHLAKLISPFGKRSDSFRIWVHADQELAEDQRLIREFKQRQKSKELEDDDAPPPRTVNSAVENFVFDTLSPRTTLLEAEITGPKGEWIESTLKDRGKLVYKIREKNPYLRLRSSDYSCSLFYLNQASKNVFRRRMGVRSVEFGSVFLFRNGFRVFPVGEEGDDEFGIDRRKQQGYARYLGTRDLIGRIDVRGGVDDFREATSRDQGLIHTPAYEELLQCFHDHGLKRLERYVTGVTWTDALDKEHLDTTRLEVPQVRARIIELLAGFAADKNVKILEFGQDIFDILSERAEEAGLSLASLRLLADTSGNQRLIQQVRKASVRFKALARSERRAREQAEEERQAREDAEARASQAEDAYSEEQKRNLFLLTQSDIDKDIVVDLHHQITIYAANLHHLLDAELRLISSGNVDPDRVRETLTDIYFCNEKILAASRLATRANFRIESEIIHDDLASYFGQYILRVCSLYQSRVSLSVVHKDNVSFFRSFKPIEVSIIVDNLVLNAHRAKASAVTVSIAVVRGFLEIVFSDDGCGFDEKIKDISRVFERGFTTTSGSGLGLHHVKSIIEEMGGSIEASVSPVGGALFKVRLPK